MTLSVSRRPARAGILATTLAAIPLGLGGCAGHAPDDIGRLQAILATCPDKPLNVYDLVDGSGTSHADDITKSRLTSIRADIEKATVCGGRAEVAAFGPNSVPVSIYEDDLATSGSTEIAQLRGVADLVDEAMSEVTKNYEPAIAAVPQAGTDVTGLYRLLGEAQEQRPDMQLQATIYTDGLTNQGVIIDRDLSDADARTLADGVSVPDLTGATVSVVGIGRVAGDPVSSAFIAGLKAFYLRLCEKTKADACLVTTDGR